VLYSERLKDAHKYPASESGSPQTAFVGGSAGGGSATGSAPLEIVSPGGSTSLGSREEWEEEVEQWKQVISILQEGGHFSGINRKAQLKPLAWKGIPVGLHSLPGVRLVTRTMPAVINRCFDCKITW
jgi:hypothetical protein